MSDASATPESDQLSASTPDQDHSAASGSRPLRYEVNGALTVPVFTREGQQNGSITLDASEFGGKISRPLLHEVVLMYLANQRSGTHSTKRRSEVAGSTKKLFRQKGTGNARVGNKRTNKRRGGGTAKGPKPRDYEYHLPKRAVRTATRMALLSKFDDAEALVIDDFGLEAIKTKEMVGILNALGLADSTVLIGTDGIDETVYRSARNVAGVAVLPVQQFHTYIVLRQKRLLLTPSALEVLRQRHPRRRPQVSVVGANLA